MALFEGNKRQEGTRSNTHLQKSGGMSPAEKWILSQQFNTDAKLKGVYKDGVLFNHQYGGPGQTEVVIAKGRVVGVGEPIKDFVSKQVVPTICLPGMTTNQNVAGVCPYNFTKDMFQFDRFGGNQPSIITREYITLPYIPGVNAASTFDVAGIVEEENALSIDLKNPWGACIGADLRIGDYVKATPSGRLVKWDKTKDSSVDVVGQILGQDFNSEPWGFLKWVLWDETALKSEDSFINRSGSSSLPSDGGYPFDSKFTEGNMIDQFNGYHTVANTNPTGIPGLHDGSGNYKGYGRKDTFFTGMALGNVPNGASEGQLITVQLVDNAGKDLGNIIADGFELKINGTAVAKEDYSINLRQGKVSFTVKAGQAGQAITATYKAEQYGQPVYLDFKGVVGSFSILLRR